MNSKYHHLLVLCLALACLLSGCSGKQDILNNSPVETRSAIKMPSLPEDLEKDGSGVPKIRVYDVSMENIELMGIEEYLEGVLAGEMKNDWPLEALKAQSILARTFVLKFVTTKESAYEGADISTSITEAQAYNAEAVNDRIRQAIQETRGLVLSSNGEFPYAWFHAHSGGMTELPENALDYKGESADYLRAQTVDESPDAPEEVRQWQAVFTKEQVRQACQDAGVSVGEIKTITIGQKGASGRAIQLNINEKTVSAPAFRIALDSTKLKSTLIDSIEIQGDSIIFSGKGFGHGVGMSQWGAYELASQGRNAEEIVRTFFHDIEIVRLWT